MAQMSDAVPCTPGVSSDARAATICSGDANAGEATAAPPVSSPCIDKLGHATERRTGFSKTADTPKSTILHVLRSAVSTEGQLSTSRPRTHGCCLA